MSDKLWIFDTKSRKKEILTPSHGGVIRMYTCGPTVYNFAHIGNLRTYVFEDLLRRTIRHFGMGVYQVMNLTDIDDKTIRGALADKLPLDVSTKRYKDAFFDDLAALNVEKAEVYPEATAHVAQMIHMIEVLIQKKVAYAAPDGNVFYRIAQFKEYGKLSHLNLADLKVGASNRVSEDEYDKENVSDFVLWKAYDPSRDGEIYWESPWGKGRPGWHIECSAMAMQYLGETLDLHVGGVDNIFPHHENEIAQSEACTGKTFARHWMHSAHLIVDGKKMSKSLGNFYTLRDLLAKGYTGREVRYLLLSTHYRASLNFTFESLNGARQALRRLDDFHMRFKALSGNGEKIDQIIDIARIKIDAALSDDLNISGALATLFDFVREINTMCDKGLLGLEAKESISLFWQELDKVLGFLVLKEEEIPDFIVDLANKRLEARAKKDFALADQFRQEITKNGFTLEDTPKGFLLKRK